MSTEHLLPVADQKNNTIHLSASQALPGANCMTFYATRACVGHGGKTGHPGYTDAGEA